MFADGQLKDGNHVIRAKGQLSQWVLFSLGSPRIAARASQPVTQNTAMERREGRETARLLPAEMGFFVWFFLFFFPRFWPSAYPGL